MIKLMKVLRWIFYFLLVSLPLGTRTLIFNFEFLYLSDILLVLFLAIFLKFNSNILKNLRINSLVIFLILAGLSVFFASVTGLAAYNLLRLALLVATSIVIGKLLKNGIVKLEGIFWTLGGLAIVQSLIGVAQFIKQSDLGLQRLGEATLGGAIPGVAKIVVEGAKIVRAYGTFPHPNILAAFLLLGLLSLYYLFLRGYSEAQPKNLLRSFTSLRMTAVAGGIFIVWLGILFSFSRTAWVIAILVTLAIIIYTLVTKSYFRQGVRLLILSVAIFATLLISFKSYIVPRAQFSVDEPAVSLRSTYNRIGLDLIKNNLFGVGIGNQVAFTRESGVYQKFGLDQPWQFQPIHNIYLLIASEIGVLGLLTFLIFVIKLALGHSEAQPKNLLRSFASLRMTAARAMLLSLLLFGFSDHFLWTSQSGQLMLWLVVGIVMGVSGDTKRS